MNSSANRSEDRISGRRNCALALATCLALCFAAPSRGQDASTLTLRQAVTLALQNSRDVKLAQVQYNVADGAKGPEERSVGRAEARGGVGARAPAPRLTNRGG